MRQGRQYFQHGPSEMFGVHGDFVGDGAGAIDEGLAEEIAVGALLPVQRDEAGGQGPSEEVAVEVVVGLLELVVSLLGGAHALNHLMIIMDCTLQKDLNYTVANPREAA